MKRQVLQDHLAQAERELAEVAARIERQKALIRKLERGGQDTAHAAFLLHQSLGLKRSMRRTGPDYSASWEALAPELAPDRKKRQMIRSDW